MKGTFKAKGLQHVEISIKKALAKKASYYECNSVCDEIRTMMVNNYNGAPWFCAMINRSGALSFVKSLRKQYKEGGFGWNYHLFGI